MVSDPNPPDLAPLLDEMSSELSLCPLVGLLGCGEVELLTMGDTRTVGLTAGEEYN